MPRIAEDRPPAEPSSLEQKRRYQRILRAAAEHGAAKGLDRVQMHDVAKDAGVAIATLYRYFPSKTHLFTAVLRSQVARLDEQTPAPDPDRDPVDAVSDLLIVAGRQLLAHPLLAHAMMKSNNASVAHPGSGEAVTEPFSGMIFQAARVTEPTPHDRRLVRLVEQTWYAILISVLNRHITAEAAEADTALACRLLLADLSSRPAS